MPTHPTECGIASLTNSRLYPFSYLWSLFICRNPYRASTTQIFRRYYCDVRIQRESENAQADMRERPSSLSLTPVSRSKKATLAKFSLSEGASTRQTCRKKARAFSPCINASAGIDRAPFYLGVKCIMPPIRPPCSNNARAWLPVTLASLISNPDYISIWEVSYSPKIRR